MYSKKGSHENLLENPRKSLGEMMSIWEKLRGRSLGAPFSNFEAICEKPRKELPCKVTGHKYILVML